MLVSTRGEYRREGSGSTSMVNWGAIASGNNGGPPAAETADHNGKKGAARSSWANRADIASSSKSRHQRTFSTDSADPISALSTLLSKQKFNAAKSVTPQQEKRSIGRFPTRCSPTYFAVCVSDRTDSYHSYFGGFLSYRKATRREHLGRLSGAVASIEAC